MKTSLWEIESQFRNIISELEENGGELTEEISESLAINKSDFEEKAESYFVVLNNYDKEIEKAKSEIERLQDKNKNREKIIDQLKKKLISAVHLYGLSKTTPTGRINYSIKFPNLDLSLNSNASESVEILDETKIKNQFIKYSLNNDFTFEEMHKLKNFIESNKIIEDIKLIKNIDKTKIKESLKNKNNVDGADLKINYNITFK